MAYRIEEIEGIGPSYGQKLAMAGVQTTGRLLELGGTSKGRNELSELTGISSAVILKWCNQADLMRVKGIGRQYAELLEAAGVDTVKELRHRNPENLAAALEAVNEEKRLARALPVVSVVRSWVERAKTLSPVISH